MDATEVSLQVSEGEVTLTGTVSSREQKRRAEECVARIRGVHDVINQLRVRRDEGSGGGGTAASRGGVATDRGRR